MQPRFFKLWALLALLLPPACRQQEPPAKPPEPEWVAPLPAESFFEVAPEKLPLLWDGEGDFASLEVALAQQRSWLARQPPGKTFSFGQRKVAAAELLRGFDLLLGKLREKPDALAFAAFVKEHFVALESVGGRDGQLLVTGYYEPILEGSKAASPDYPAPIYGRPPGLSLVSVDLGAFDEKWRGQRVAGQLKDGKLVPYADRRQIRDQGLLRGQEIAWAKDPIDAFFLEVQGSGTLRLPDGGELRIGYAGANGRPYRSIGKALIDQGKLPKSKVSMQTIRAYLEAHPEEMNAIFDENPSMVFFHVLDTAAVGSLGFPVTAGRSVAADPQYFPQGAFAFLLTEKPHALPDGTGEVEDLLTRFVVVQDTGGAIRGPGRIDFFWGRGHEAGERAGVMKQPGRIFLLLPK